MEIEQHFEEACRTVSNVFKHCKKIRDYASRCQHVTEIGLRSKALCVALLAAEPLTYEGLAQSDAEFKDYEIFLKSIECGTKLSLAKQPNPEKIVTTDLLVLNTKLAYTRVRSELAKHCNFVSKFILIPGTYEYADRGEDGHRPGIMQAIIEFTQENPSWAIDYNETVNNGLVVLKNCEEVTSENERIYSMVNFEIPDIRWIERIPFGMSHPSCSALTEEEAQQQLDRLNKALRYGVIVGVERNFTTVKISDKEIMLGYLVYHVGYRSRPL